MSLLRLLVVTALDTNEELLCLGNSFDLFVEISERLKEAVGKPLLSEGVHSHQVSTLVVDPKGAPGKRAPLSVQFISFSCSFRQNLCQVIFGVPPSRKF